MEQDSKQEGKEKDSPTVKYSSPLIVDNPKKTNPPGVGTWLGFNFYDLR